MASVLRQIRRTNRLGARSIAEPFAGGAGASLALLYLEEASDIYINDADRAIHDFWWAMTKRRAQFTEMLASAPVDLTEWRRQRDVYRSIGRISRLRRGFAAFYLNRCNRSGIIMNGGPIGGLLQDGPWKLDARFNKVELRRRCEKVAEYRDRIHISNTDGVEFIKNLPADSTLFFIDPPYYVKGRTLYLNALDHQYHLTLARTLKLMKKAAWVVTYDDCPEVRAMYEGWATIRPFALRYVAAVRRTGKEILITPKWMRLPTSQASAAVTW